MLQHQLDAGDPVVLIHRQPEGRGDVGGRWVGMVELDRYLNQQGAQGSALGRSWVAPQAE